MSEEKYLQDNIKKDALEEKTIVSFFLAEQEFGIDIRFIQEIIQMVEITKVPDSPSYIEGIINLRGEIVPIVKLRVLINLGKTNISLNTPILIVNSKDIKIGFIIDSVEDVINIPAKDIEASSKFYPIADFLDGVGKLKSRLLPLFDVNKLISMEKRNLLKQLTVKE